MDSLSKEERSEIMARVRSKDMRPELAVRKLVFALGYRYRLHVREAAVQQIADTMIADSAAASMQTAIAERSSVLKTLRAELKGKESDLDSLIKSLINFPPKTGDAPGDDAKQMLKTRIGELTELVNTLRDRLNHLESDKDTNA